MTNDLLQLSPVIVVLATGLAILVMDVFRQRAVGGSSHLTWLTSLGLAAATLAVWKLWPGSEVGLASPFLAGAMVVDGFTLFLWGILLVGGICTALMSNGYDAEHNLDHGEYYSFLAFSLAAMMVMVGARNLVTFFLALETMSLAIYVLVAMKRSSDRSAEAAFKYFLNGGFASALMLYGMALVWGESGTLDLAGIGQALVAGGGNVLLYMGTGLLLVGLAFKAALVPFHMWTPDAYHGAPTPIGGFMAAAVKATAFGAMIRIVYVAMLPEALSSMPFSWSDLIVLLAVLTMTVGNLLAMHQPDVRRMLAYSSVSHAGYVVMGLLLVPPLGSGHPDLRFVSGSVLFYLAAYGASTLLAFGVLAHLGKGGDEAADGGRLDGLARRRPGLALLLTLALLSLAGFPPTAGFFAKFDLFRQLMVLGRGKLGVLLVIAVINALFSVYYYLRPVVHMYMRESDREHNEIRSPAAGAALVFLAVVVLAMGILPGRLSSLASDAGKTVTYEHAPNLFGKGPARLAPFAREENESQ